MGSQSWHCRRAATIEPSTPSPALPLGKGEGAWKPSCRCFYVPLAEDTRSRPPFRRVSGSERAAKNSYVRQWTARRAATTPIQIQIGIDVLSTIPTMSGACGNAESAAGLFQKSGNSGVFSKYVGRAPAEPKPTSSASMSLEQIHPIRLSANLPARHYLYADLFSQGG